MSAICVWNILLWPTRYKITTLTLPPEAHAKGHDTRADIVGPHIVSANKETDSRCAKNKVNNYNNIRSHVNVFCISYSLIMEGNASFIGRQCRSLKNRRHFLVSTVLNYQ